MRGLLYGHTLRRRGASNPWSHMRRRSLWRVDASQADRVSQLLSDEGPALDTAEQVELVQAFEAAHAAQSRLWRLCFAAVGALLGIMLLWFGLDQQYRPWVGYRHHSVFHRTAPAALVAAAELLSGATMMAAAAVLSARVVRRQTVRQGRKDDVPEDGAAKAWQRWESAWAVRVLSVAVVLCLFWTWALGESLHRRRVTGPQAGKLLWLPGGPIGYAGFVFILLRMLRNTKADIVALRTQMYAFHKA